MLEANPNDGAEWSDCAERSEADEVTATVTSTNPPPRRTPTVAEFMSAVVAWPGICCQSPPRSCSRAGNSCLLDQQDGATTA
jgi:hypothetical protein